MSRESRLPRALALVAGAALAAAAVVVPAAPASAAVFPNDDEFLVYAGATYTLDPLANDDVFLGSGDPYLCGISGGTSRVYAVIEDGKLVVEADEGYRATVTYTYDACQGNDRKSATITLEVDALADLGAAKKRRTKGKAVFTNPNPVAVRVAWGSASSGKADGSKVIGAGRSVVVSTKRKAVYWVGIYSDADTIITVGDGVVSGLQSKR